ATNARDAMPRGGRLEIETDLAGPGTALALRHPDLAGGAVVLRVRDTGAGMDRETLSRAFEPFFTTKDPSRGTGLGLSVVYGIVRQHSGIIDVESEPGQGTCFTLAFPPAPRSAVSAARETEAGHLPRGRETLLVVEDEVAVRSVAVRILTHLGYQVLQASDGQAALEMMERHGEPVRLVITDMVMPRMSGRELAQRLTGLRPGIRFIYTSGYSGDGLEAQGGLDLAAHFLPKPYSPRHLAHMVRAVLDGK
ncbi:MAG: response regulator, partial [Deltaproteobacteria bacterium]|nr:response regulator [Deltaproteobacteria bacterium]